MNCDACAAASVCTNCTGNRRFGAFAFSGTPILIDHESHAVFCGPVGFFARRTVRCSRSPRHGASRARTLRRCALRVASERSVQNDSQSLCFGTWIHCPGARVYTVKSGSLLGMHLHKLTGSGLPARRTGWVQNSTRGSTALEWARYRYKGKHGAERLFVKDRYRVFIRGFMIQINSNKKNPPKENARTLAADRPRGQIFERSWKHMVCDALHPGPRQNTES